MSWWKLLVAVIAATPPLASRSADAADAGKWDPASAKVGAGLFRAHCATCHGLGGEGDGPFAPRLRVAPPDLTTLAKRNGDRFPFDKVYRTIDGRDPVDGHGGGGMPVWGDDFLDSREGFSPAKVREKVNQLVHYLASIQREAK